MLVVDLLASRARMAAPVVAWAPDPAASAARLISGVMMADWLAMTRSTEPVTQPGMAASMASASARA